LGRNRFSPKRFWRKIFHPPCFGRERDFRRCGLEFIRTKKLPCRYYDECMTEMIHRSAFVGKAK